MKKKTMWEIAAPIAGYICEELSPFCTRIESAGSLRRNEKEVGDIEIVAQPIMKLDMFSAVTKEHRLNDYPFTQIGTMVKNGNKYKQIALHDGITLDLFMVTPPAQWGVQLLIRTGPADFSHRFVTKKKYGGLLPSNLRVKDGAIWSNNHIIETPNEEDVFEVLGIPFIEPKDRQ